jgi:glutaredoxin 3
MIRMYVKPWCPYCGAARRLLAAKGRPWKEIDIAGQPQYRAEMIERSGCQTVPQIWIGERHIGGYDNLAALDDSGELDEILREPHDEAGERAK